MNSPPFPKFYQYKVIAQTNDPASPIETAYLVTLSRDAVCKEIIAKNLPLNSPLRDIAETMARGKCSEIFPTHEGRDMCLFISTPVVISKEDERRFKGRDVIVGKQISIG